MFKERIFDLLAASLPKLATGLSCNLHKEFQFDVIASPSEKVSDLINPNNKEDNALKKNWFDHSENKSILFVPPADERIGRWLAKAVYESRKGATVIGILPVKIDKDWFHKYIQNVACEVRFIKITRPSFLGMSLPTEPIAVVIFKPFKGKTLFTSARFNGEVEEHLN